jgi:tripartite-type tricarboxylate transporter receptor subunit TctC
MHKSKTLLVSMSIGFILNAVGYGEAPAQSWPARPITMVIPFAAGSGIDVLGRALGPALSEILGQQVVVENIGGAGGMTGAARVARAAPDGYQFVLGNVGTHAHSQSLYAKPLYNPGTDFAPVALVADTPQVLIARADLPAGNLREFIAYTKANQSKLQYGSPGAGSAAHLGCVLLNSAMGVAVTHVPYRGGAQAMQDLIAGRIDYQCPLLALALPHIESKKVKGLAVLTRDRSEIQPALASAREQGLADFELSTWNAFFLPKGTPPAIVGKLHSATMTAMESPSLRQALKKIGAELVPPERRSPAYLQGFVQSEVKKWTAVIRAAGITAE